MSNDVSPSAVANPQTERHFLALLAMDGEAIGPCLERIPSKALSGGLFTTPAHQAIWAEMLRLFNAGRTVSILVLRDALSRSGTLAAAGGETFLANLNDGVYWPEGARELADALVDYWRRRSIIGLMQHVQADAMDGRPFEAIVAETERELFEITAPPGAAPFEALPGLTEEQVGQVRMRGHHGDCGGIKTGFYKLDMMLQGLRPGDLIILAARPSMGKTAFATCIALNAAQFEGAHVAFHSLEMTKRDLAQRILSIRSRIPFGVLRGNYPLDHFQIEALTRADASLKGVPLFVCDQSRLTTAQLKSKTLHLMTQHPGRWLVVVDYLGKVKPSDRYRGKVVKEVGEIAGDLKAIAMDLNVPVLALCQLNRSIEHRQEGAGKRKAGVLPTLADLRDSGEIEQDADVVIFVHRDKERSPELATIRIGKHRNGPIGDIELGFDGDHTEFRNLKN